MVEPADAAAGAEVLFLGGDGFGRLMEHAGWFGPGEVDVDATDTAGAELDETGTDPFVGLGLLTAAQSRDQFRSDDARLSFRPNSVSRAGSAVLGGIAVVAGFGEGHCWL